MKLVFMFAAFLLPAGIALLPPACASPAGRADIDERSASPYLGAIVIDADTGEVLFEENADAACYPASIIKLMDLLVIQEKLEGNALRLSDKVPVTAEASRIGGSQVYLKENEAFPVEELLYALMVQSANDAAVALSLHVSGSTGSFIELMQKRGGELGLKNTRFHSVHGLPPARGQEPDVSTPRELASLARELLKHPAILRYTGTAVRGFRNDTMEMRNHNKLLGSFAGCDGLKTGYFRLGGYSIVATASRGGNRFIAVVAGSKDKKVRDAKARELLSRAFAEATPHPAVKPTPVETPAVPATAPKPLPKKPRSIRARKMALLVLVVAAVAAFSYWLGMRQSRRRPPPGIHYGLK